VFWIWFAASIGFGRRYPWLDTVWYAAGMLVVLGFSAYAVVHRLRHRDEPGALSHQFMPRWLERFISGEDTREVEPEAPVTKNRNSANSDRSN